MYAAPAFSEIAVARVAATSSRVAPALIAASAYTPMQPSQRVVMAQVGYQSQAAFSKKFKETYGEAPGRVRAR